MISVSPKTISSYETNRSLPNIEILILLTKILNTNIDTILGLDKYNVKDMKKIYEEENVKDSIVKLVLMCIIAIIPMIFFWYAGYVSISAFSAKVISESIINIDNISSYARSTLGFFNYFFIEYVIYLVIIIINYILYKKKKGILLLTIDIFIIVLFVINTLVSGFYAFDTLIFLLSAIVGIILSIKILKKSLK